jgi:hypothetical protein
MGNKITWQQAQSYKKIVRYIEENTPEDDEIVDNGFSGSHNKRTSVKTGKSAILPLNDSYPAGTKSSIKRQLIAMGIPIISLIGFLILSGIV